MQDQSEAPSVTSPESRVTKQQLDDHLNVTRRWIELQQPRGLPHLSTPRRWRHGVCHRERPYGELST
jgi:hypothetical protein